MTEMRPRAPLDMSETIGELVERITSNPGGFVELRIETAEYFDVHAWAAPDDVS